MDWAPVSAMAAVAAALFAALAWRTSRRAIKLQEETGRQSRAFQLQQLKETLRLAKWLLENPPHAGFDHAPKPNFPLDRLTEALSTKGLLNSEAAISVRAAHDALLEVHRTIAETEDPAMAPAVQFRKRFPDIKNRALSAINESLKVLDVSS